MTNIRNIIQRVLSYLTDKARLVLSAVSSLFWAKDEERAVSHARPSSSLDASNRMRSEFKSTKEIFVCRVLHGEPNWFKQLFVIASGLIVYLAGLLTGIMVLHFYG